MLICGGADMLVSHVILYCRNYINGLLYLSFVVSSVADHSYLGWCSYIVEHLVLRLLLVSILHGRAKLSTEVGFSGP